MARKIYQCEQCKGYTDYELTLIELKAADYSSGTKEWCDDCLAKVKQRPTIERPKPMRVEA